MKSALLKEFRQAAYSYLGRAHDATFELMDAILLTRNAYSLADLSLSPVFRRKWPSIYEALQDSRPQRQKLMQLYIKQMPQQGRPLLAGDHTAWSRPDAVTLIERTIEHTSVTITGNKPITVGQGYSTIAWIPEDSGSWALPLRHERITSWENPIQKATWQLQQVCEHLPTRPITVWDSEYGCAPFVLKTTNIKADILVRLRSNLCLWGAPPPYSGKGRPRKHGDKFKLNDPSTWSEANESIEVNHPKLGRVKVSLWKNLHFRQTATRPMSLIRVERLDAEGNLRISKPLWLAWVGEEMLPLSQVWQLYLRRFTVDHWYRFLKQRLHWTLPKLSSPKQSEHWSDLMPLMTWELWLARDIVADNPLPWQKSLDNLTPGRVAQAMGSIFAVIGTPARSPKPRGKSPGWKPGKPRQRRIRYPIVKKTTTKPRKKHPESA
ncbi:transposase [Desmonostoc muscorum LEGE 12446]|nr:NF041680 family putative transposase [Desmonostoc muscorum]MCF2145979.1 transposase [Desmonostoc muscorum LEGE 12446]MCF2149702.1 transposase [Desmonostoc muscorum LEGE 12446]MCF2149828.1 transposase [Desmonostoc muscorum LEGE 12446]MCF2151958.1 transposase [Desmonostoc muscorum LEGE 12446]MCF2151983.1 transposase [Desmonostoc muscorum LEGE 12446]